MDLLKDQSEERELARYQTEEIVKINTNQIRDIKSPIGTEKVGANDDQSNKNSQ
jgi:hypothetical protein